MLLMIMIIELLVWGYDESVAIPVLKKKKKKNNFEKCSCVLTSVTSSIWREPPARPKEKEPHNYVDLF